MVKVCDSSDRKKIALSLLKDVSKGLPKTKDTKPFATCEGWLYRFRNRFKRVKISQEAVSARKEAAVTLCQS
jgi:hypothetical protein